MPEILYLIDGHGLAYRTYFALTAGAAGNDRWLTSTGEPIAGVYGFASVLLRLFEQEHPDFLAVAFDTGKTFRNETFAGYKATRQKMPDDLVTQMRRIRELVDAFSIPRLELEGYEADDVLGSVARQVTAQGLGVKIVTGDKDLLQLVDERIVVNLAGKVLSEAKDYLPADVQSFLGVRPDQVVDYKALVGDKSDNIPGVAGIGEKTAISLLETYQTLDEIYAHLAEIPARFKTKLEAGRDAAYMSQNLAQIRTNAPISLNLENSRTANYDPRNVEAFFRELEFRTLMKRFTDLQNRGGNPLFPQPAVEKASAAEKASAGEKLPQVAAGATKQLSLFAGEVHVLTPAAAQPSDLHTVIVDTPEALDDLVSKLNAADRIAFDTETDSTDAVRARLVGISLAVQAGEGYYVPVGHQAHLGEKQLKLSQVIEALRGPLTNPRIQKIGHNLKYDFMVLKQHGLTVTPLNLDTMIAEWLINPASRNLGLKNLAWIRLESQMTHIEDLIGKGKNQITMDQVPIQAAASYAAADAETTYRLAPVLEKELEQYQSRRLLDEIEMPLVPVLASMELAGIAVDVPFFQRMSEELRQSLTRTEQQIYETVGASFNLNSTQQLSVILFDRLRLAPPDRRKRTSSGHYSTSADVLEDLKGQHPVVDWILDYRELSKLKSTYVDALPQQINPRTGRIHTSFSQTGAVTGRLSSSDPNLQNIPTRTELGRRVRIGFIASPGNVLLSVDYSQIELRIVACMANDEAMLNAFRQGQDIHTTTAAAIYGIPLGEVTKDQRRNAKGINFGLIYGMSSFGLSRATSLTLAEAENFSQAYFKQFPGVKRYLDGIRRQAAEQGYVETLFGRRRYFPGLRNQTNPNLKNREEREAINAPIQGTAADIIKIAMCRVPDALRGVGLSGKMLLQVHDELVLEVPTGELAQTTRIVRQVMESAYPLAIPMTTEAKSGVNWGEMTIQTLNA